MSKKLLIIGPSLNLKNPNRTGGIIILFENLKKVLSSDRIDYKLVDSNKNNYSNKLFAYISILFKLTKEAKKTNHISMHGTINDYLYIGPYIYIISKIFNIKFSLRKFAGNFDIFFKKTNLLNRKIIIFLLKKSSSNFFETKYLVDFFKVYNSKTYWFPNVRFKSEFSVNRSYNKKFVFMSHIKVEKGIDIILEASNLLSNDYEFHFYGEIMDEKYSRQYFDNYKNCIYHGSIDGESVIKTLNEYDVVLLPTFWIGEGYPGIIIEAYSIGIPVISTSRRGISEIVANDSTGILIPPKDANALYKAIKSINKDSYMKYSNNAFTAFNQFDSVKCTRNYIHSIQNI